MTDTTSQGIYIKCRPVDELNRPITSSLINTDGDTLSQDKVNELISPEGDYSFLQDQTSSIMIGVILMLITYYIGRYVFKNVPDNIISREKMKEL
tara:strand:- start:284 stop:568 length:285 start_codon:yes stop_codon:yes gene_type:complete